MQSDSDITIRMLNDLQTYFMNELEGGIATLSESPNAWAFVGTPIEKALSQLRVARSFFPEHASPSFLECGAGLGFIVMLAKQLNFKAQGIELSERYVTLAKKLFPSTNTKQGDVLMFEDYAHFDVIFYYGPFKEDEDMIRFEQKIESAAKHGCIFIGNRNVSRIWEHSDAFKLIQTDSLTSFIYQKLA